MSCSCCKNLSILYRKPGLGRLAKILHAATVANSLVVLDVSQNAIGVVGAHDLASFIYSSTTLRELITSRNRLCGLDERG